jgi:hypothetical protein
LPGVGHFDHAIQKFNDSGRPAAIKSLPTLPKAPDLSEKRLKY